MEGSYRHHNEKYGARCCNGDQCITSYDCKNNPNGSLTYSEAVQFCEDEGLNLCSKAQLLSEICCNTGGGCDSIAVWTSTPEGTGNIQFLDCIS